MRNWNRGLPDTASLAALKKTFGEMTGGVSDAEKCARKGVTKSSRSVIICLYAMPAMRLGGHPSASFSGHTGFFPPPLLCSVSMDMLVGNLTNVCLWIHERKFYRKKGQKAVYKRW